MFLHQWSFWSPPSISWFDNYGLIGQTIALKAIPICSKRSLNAPLHPRIILHLFTAMCLLVIALRTLHRPPSWRLSSSVLQQKLTFPTGIIKVSSNPPVWSSIHTPICPLSKSSHILFTLHISSLSSLMWLNDRPITPLRLLHPTPNVSISFLCCLAFGADLYQCERSATRCELTTAKSTALTWWEDIESVSY